MSSSSALSLSSSSSSDSESSSNSSEYPATKAAHQPPPGKKRGRRPKEPSGASKPLSAAAARRRAEDSQAVRSAGGSRTKRSRAEMKDWISRGSGAGLDDDPGNVSAGLYYHLLVHVIQQNNVTRDIRINFAAAFPDVTHDSISFHLSMLRQHAREVYSLKLLDEADRARKDQVSIRIRERERETLLMRYGLGLHAGARDMLERLGEQDHATPKKQGKRSTKDGVVVKRRARPKSEDASSQSSADSSLPPRKRITVDLGNALDRLH